MTQTVVNQNKNYQAAMLMLRRGGWWTAGELAKAMGFNPRYASGVLLRLRNSQRYKTEETPLPGRKVKVVAIGEPTKAGRKKIKPEPNPANWNAALAFKPPRQTPSLYCC